MDRPTSPPDNVLDGQITPPNFHLLLVDAINQLLTIVNMDLSAYYVFQPLPLDVQVLPKSTAYAHHWLPFQRKI